MTYIKFRWIFEVFKTILIASILTLTMTGCFSFCKNKNSIKDFPDFNYIAANFKIIQEVSITYKKFQLSGIMITKFSKENIIESILLAPSGIKLMEFIIVKNKFKKINFSGEFKGNKQIFKKILEIFLTTYSDYKIKYKPKEISYNENSTLYKFGKKKKYYLIETDKNNKMVNKKFVKNNKEIISIEYKDHDEKYIHFPATIIYENYKDKIKITHLLKDITPLE